MQDGRTRAKKEKRKASQAGAQFVDDQMMLAPVVFGIHLAVRALGVAALMARLVD